MRAEANQETETMRKGRRKHCISEVSTCGCSTCSLYRWYPPLLIVSTVLAGLFCTLYLTKPVRIVSPQEWKDLASPSHLPVRERVPENGRPAPAPDNLVKEIGEELSPFTDGLPGEMVAETQEGSSDVGLGSSDGGEEFKPLVVNSPRRSLFVPLSAKPQIKNHWSDQSLVGSGDVSAGGGSPQGSLMVEMPPENPSKLVNIFGRESEDGNLHGLDLQVPPASLGVHLTEAERSDVRSSMLGEDESLPASIVGEFFANESEQGDLEEEKPEGIVH